MLLAVEKFRLEAKPPDPSEIICRVLTIETKPFPCEQLVTGRPLTFCLFCGGTFCLGVQTCTSSGSIVGSAPPAAPAGALAAQAGRHPCGTSRVPCPQACGSQRLSHPGARTEGCGRHHCSPERDRLFNRWPGLCPALCPPGLTGDPRLSRLATHTPLPQNGAAAGALPKLPVL